MLSQESLNQLKKILKKELGESVERFSDAQIQTFGMKLLGLTSKTLKHKLSVQSSLKSESGKI